MVDVSPWNNMHVHGHVAFDGMLGTCRIGAPYPYLVPPYAGIGSRKDYRVVGAYPEMHDMSIAIVQDLGLCVATLDLRSGPDYKYGRRARGYAYTGMHYY